MIVAGMVEAPTRLQSLMPCSLKHKLCLEWKVLQSLKLHECLSINIM